MERKNKQILHESSSDCTFTLNEAIKTIRDKTRLVNSHYINIDPQDQDPLPVTTIALWLIHTQP